MVLVQVYEHFKGKSGCNCGYCRRYPKSIKLSPLCAAPDAGLM